MIELLTEWRDSTVPADVAPPAKHQAWDGWQREHEQKKLNHRAFFDMKCQQLIGRRLEPGGIYAGFPAPTPPPSSPAAAGPGMLSLLPQDWRYVEGSERPVLKPGEWCFPNNPSMPTGWNVTSQPHPAAAGSAETKAKPDSQGHYMMGGFTGECSLNADRYAAAKASSIPTGEGKGGADA